MAFFYVRLLLGVWGRYEPPRFLAPNSTNRNRNENERRPAVAAPLPSVT